MVGPITVGSTSGGRQHQRNVQHGAHLLGFGNVYPQGFTESEEFANMLLYIATAVFYLFALHTLVRARLR